MDTGGQRVPTPSPSPLQAFVAGNAPSRALVILLWDLTCDAGIAADLVSGRKHHVDSPHAATRTEKRPRNAEKASYEIVACMNLDLHLVNYSLVAISDEGRRIPITPIISPPPYILKFGPFYVEVPPKDEVKPNFRTPPMMLRFGKGVAAKSI